MLKAANLFSQLLSHILLEVNAGNLVATNEAICIPQKDSGLKNSSSPWSSAIIQSAESLNLSDLLTQFDEFCENPPIMPTKSHPETV